MWLTRAAKTIGKGLQKVIPSVGNLASVLVTLMMLLTTADIIGRRLFSHPILGSYELSQYLLVVVTFAAITQCEFFKGHIAIDLLVTKMGERYRNAIASVMYLMFFGMSILLTWRLFVDGIDTWQKAEVSQILKVPKAPFVLLAGLGCALLIWVVLVHLIEYIAGALKK